MYEQTDFFDKYLERLKIPSQCEPIALSKWTVYFGDGRLEDFQELCDDLGIADDTSSKRRCMLALNRLNVNIPQFLRAMGNPSLHVIKFRSRRELIQFTTKKGKRKERMISKDDIPQGSPLRALLEELF